MNNHPELDVPEDEGEGKTFVTTTNHRRLIEITYPGNPYVLEQWLYEEKILKAKEKVATTGRDERIT